MPARVPWLLVAALVVVVAIAGCSVAGAAVGVVDPGFIQSPVPMADVAALRPGIGVTVILKDYRTNAEIAATPGGEDPPTVMGKFARVDEVAATVVVVDRMGRQQAIEIGEIEKVERDNTLWSVLGGAITGAIVDVVLLIFVAPDKLF